MHKQSDKLATVQRIKCHALDIGGTAFNISQNLKLY